MTAAVELTDDPAVDGTIGEVVGIEQVESHPPGPNLPGAEMHIATGKVQADRHPLALRVPQRGDGELAWVVEGEELDLLTGRGEGLTEVALLPEQTDPDKGHSQVARG